MSKLLLSLKEKWNLKLEEKTKIIQAGKGAAVPLHKEQSVCALSRVGAVDAWHPLREDYRVLQD